MTVSTGSQVVLNNRRQSEVTACIDLRDGGNFRCSSHKDLGQ